MRYEVRAALPDDCDALFELARYLDTVNLPHERAAVRELLELSEASFSGRLTDAAAHRYVFLLWDRDAERAVGTSTIVAQHGRPDSPYIYFSVLEDERYSRSLKRHFRHDVLRLGFAYDGPTELGGLVVHPDTRGAPERLGKLIFCVRFLYIASRRPRFRDHVIAELLPPLEPDGRSHLWEALGRHFTGMSYSEADILSSRDKTFIRDLFPSSDIYVSLLAPEARHVIGRVGEQTRAVERMLVRAGFQYAKRVDPFDGGPHFLAETDRVTLIRDVRALTLRKELAEPALSGAPTGIVGCHFDAPPYFRAVRTAFLVDSGERLLLPAASLRTLDAPRDAPLWVLPLEAPAPESAPRRAAPEPAAPHETQ